MVPLESVTKTLQNNCITSSDVRSFFDAVVEQYPDANNRLITSVDIVHCPSFESGIVKIQRGDAGWLTQEERFVVCELREARIESVVINK